MENSFKRPTLYWGVANRLIKTLHYAFRIAAQSHRKGPTTAFIAVTRHCDKFCRHCYEYDNSLPVMSKELHGRILKKLYDQGVTFIFYYGGEPMSHPQIAEFIKDARKHPFNINICTDLSSSSHEQLVNVLAAGAETISFSVDSLKKDEARNIEKISSNLKFLRDLRDKGWRFGLNCAITLHKGSLNEVRDIVGCVNDTINASFSVQPAQYPVAYPQAAKKNPGVLDKDDVSEVKILMQWLKKNARMIPPEKYLDDFHKYIEGSHRWECAANRRTLFVDCDGELRICSYFIKQKPPAPLIPLSENIDSLAIGHWEKVKSIMEQNWEYCNAKCYTQGYYCPEFYTKHYITAIIRYFQSYF